MALKKQQKLPEQADWGAIRRDAGVTATEMAAACGVATQTIYAWEGGVNKPTGLQRTAYTRVLRRLEAEVDQNQPVNADG